MNPIIDTNGIIRYYNEIGRLHRTDGPALIYPNGSKMWYRHGKLHRTDGPAVIHSDGYKEWFQNGESIRETFMQCEISKINFLVEGF